MSVLSVDQPIYYRKVEGCKMGIEMERRKINIDQTPKINDAGNKGGKGNEGSEKLSDLKVPKNMDRNEIRNQIKDQWNKKS